MPEFHIGKPFDAWIYEELTERAAVECFKWNLGAGDYPTTCRYPVVLGRQQWNQLASLSESLEQESGAAERELIDRPDVHGRLGFPKKTAAHLAKAKWSNAPRYTRYDFHLTHDGFRITESNSDVAGGLLEASGVGSILANILGRKPPDDPAAAYAESFLRRFGSGARVGLGHLGTYSEDRQVVLYLKQRMEERGLATILFEPAQLRPGLRAVTQSGLVELDALYRFFPGDWLQQLPATTGWSELFCSDRVSNPLTTMLVQSKRFPLVWSELASPMNTWKQLLPQTTEPSEDQLFEGGWVFKPALGHEGANILMDGVTPEMSASALRGVIRRQPHLWIAQRRFDMVPIETPEGQRFICIGVFVVDGRAAGAYARLSEKPVIDDAAQEAVVLVEEQ